MIYNLEYGELDSMGRAQKFKHVGVYGSITDVEQAKQLIINNKPDQPVKFNIFLIQNIFEKITQS